MLDGGSSRSSPDGLACCIASPNRAAGVSFCWDWSRSMALMPGNPYCIRSTHPMERNITQIQDSSQASAFHADDREREGAGCLQGWWSLE